MSWRRAIVMVGLMLVFVTDASGAMSERDRNRTIACMIDHASRSDREKMATVLVQAVVRSEVRRADYNAYIQSLVDLLDRCGVELGELTDEETLQAIVGGFGRAIVEEGMNNVK